VSYHTHIPEYIPMYTWKGLVEPMWKVIRFNVLMADLTLVPSKTMKARPAAAPPARRSPALAARARLAGVAGGAPASWGRSGPALRQCPAGVAGTATRWPWTCALVRPPLRRSRRERGARASATCDRPLPRVWTYTTL